ncbi:MAG: hypothetical protein ACRC0X_09370 [Brevinema sp.]
MTVLQQIEKLIHIVINEKIASPVLAKISKVDNKEYTCDCIELDNEGQELETIYTRVKIPKLLASKDGGIFLTPSKGTVVLLNFLNGDRNYPMISAVMGGSHSPISEENKLVITANGKDLGEILVTICQKISALQTAGSPTTQTLRPDQIADWEIFIEQEIKSLFEVK